MDLLQDLLQEFVPGIRVFIRSLQSKVCDSRSGGPERAPPGASEEVFFRAFSIQDENKVMFFSEFVSGSLFETFFSFFLKTWRPSDLEGHSFKAKTYWYLDISSFFQFGVLFEKSAFFEFQGSVKRASGSSREASKQQYTTENWNSEFVQCFSNFQFSKGKRRNS